MKLVFLVFIMFLFRVKGKDQAEGIGIVYHRPVCICRLANVLRFDYVNIINIYYVFYITMWSHIKIITSYIFPTY